MGMNENNQGLVNGYVEPCRPQISQPHCLTSILRFMAMAGVGTGLAIGPLAVQARFSQPEARNAIVSALTLFVSYLWSYWPPAYILNLSLHNSSGPLVGQSASLSAALFLIAKSTITS